MRRIDILETSTKFHPVTKSTLVDRALVVDMI